MRRAGYLDFCVYRKFIASGKDVKVVRKSKKVVLKLHVKKKDVYAAILKQE